MGFETEVKETNINRANGKSILRDMSGGTVSVSLFHPPLSSQPMFLLFLPLLHMYKQPMFIFHTKPIFTFRIGPTCIV